MEPARIAALLAPFVEGAPLSPGQLTSISTYIDVLLRWNARVSLTAVRAPEDIVTRHFGESFFAAHHLFPDPGEGGTPPTPPTLADFGSGAGFPGIPIKLWVPEVRVTLIESNQKKATFLREVIRATKLTDIDVLAARADTDPAAPPLRFEVVTLRAVERFGQILPVAAGLVRPGGRLALLIGEGQAPVAHSTLSPFTWAPALPLPASQRRVLLVGSAP
jgi:16S rRNA (guanine527-N7)-methyltransferase